MTILYFSWSFIQFLKTAKIISALQWNSQSSRRNNLNLSNLVFLHQQTNRQQDDVRPDSVTFERPSLKSDILVLQSSAGPTNLLPMFPLSENHFGRARVCRIIFTRPNNGEIKNSQEIPLMSFFLTPAPHFPILSLLAKLIVSPAGQLLCALLACNSRKGTYPCHCPLDNVQGAFSFPNAPILTLPLCVRNFPPN